MPELDRERKIVPPNTEDPHGPDIDKLHQRFPEFNREDIANVHHRHVEELKANALPDLHVHVPPLAYRKTKDHFTKMRESRGKREGQE